jgi:SWI/SNF-related matrix-associated actin-dependent regulator 1 of chromatin subfamily A
MRYSYQIKNEQITFKTPYDPVFIEDVKQISGRKYDPQTKTWSCPINFASSKQIKNIIDKYSFISDVSECSSNENDISYHLDIVRSSETRIPMISDKIRTINLPYKAREYQLRGIAYMLESKRMIQGAAMGTGKTMMAMIACEIENIFPCIVITPASVKYNWFEQWKKLFPARSVSIIESDRSDFSCDVLIMTYDAVGTKEEVDDKVSYDLKYDQLKKITFRGIICDEAQRLKNGKSIRSRTVRKLAKKIEYRFMLTGTPVLNRPSEIINILSTLGQFDPLFGNWKDFVYKYCAAFQTRYGLDYSGASNTIELNKKLKEACYFRVEKRDVLKDLPSREETVLEVELSNRREYIKAQIDLFSYLNDNVSAEKANNALMAEQLVLISTLLRLSAEGKREAIEEWVDDFLESTNDKLVVFGVHTEILKNLAKKYKSDIIIGEVDNKKRHSIIKNFQVSKSRILFMNILTGGEGIDGLQNVCNTMLFIELPYRPTDIEQAISRIERSGQKSNISIYYMLGKDSFDQDMWQLLNEKSIVTDAVNAGKVSKGNTSIRKMLMNLSKNVIN